MLTRRSLLAASAATALPAALLAPWAALAATPTVDSFMRMSASLVGVAQTELSRDMGAAMLGALTARLGEEKLAALIADPASDAKLADEVMVGWYAGVVAGPDGNVVVGYTDARIWDVLDFAHPPGVCGGATNYWADPPET